MSLQLLQRLEDERCCHAVLARYGHALDWLDAPALAGVFWPDAAIDYGFFKGTGAAFVEAVLQIEQGAERRFHLCANTVLTFESTGTNRPDSACAESLGVTQSIRANADGKTISVYYGRYLDRLTRRADEWRIAERTYLLHGAQALPYVEGGSLSGLPLAAGLGPDHPLRPASAL